MQQAMDDVDLKTLAHWRLLLLEGQFDIYKQVNGEEEEVLPPGAPPSRGWAGGVGDGWPGGNRAGGRVRLTGAVDGAESRTSGPGRGGRAPGFLPQRPLQCHSE